MTPNEEQEILANRQVVPNRTYGRRKLDWVTRYLAFLGAFLGGVHAGFEVLGQVGKFIGTQGVLHVWESTVRLWWAWSAFIRIFP